MDQTYRSEDALQEATYDKSEVQYLYKDGDRYSFMDLESYDQFELMEADIEDILDELSPIFRATKLGLAGLRVHSS